MANPDYGELATVTIEKRRKKLADNITDNIALLNRLKSQGNAEPADGGTVLLEELEYAENQTYKRYAGYELLDIRPQTVFTAAEFQWRQCATAVSISGLEEIINAGQPRMIRLLASRIKNAEKSMMNNMSTDIYSNGTADGGKQIDGMQVIVSDAAKGSQGTHGGINSNTFTFWQNERDNTAVTSTNIRQRMMAMYLNICRNMDKVDLIPCDNNYYQTYWASLEDKQRFASSKMADSGFQTLKFLGSDVVLDGGQRGSCPENHMYLLNSDYIHYRPSSKRNMVSGKDRYATNQDAMVKLILWAGNMTVSNKSLQGVLLGTASGS